MSSHAHHGGLLVEARRVLRFNQQQLATQLKSSLRTVQRWELGKAHIYPEHLRRAAALVHSQDSDLASQLAVAGGTTLVGLGLEQPPSPPVTPPPPAAVEAPPRSPPQAEAPALPPSPVTPERLGPVHLARIVACAAADAASTPPSGVRPILVAALRAMVDAKLTVEEVLEGLTAAEVKTRGDGSG
jgi:transcriptional regulator with XRE-family HTH domain